MKHLLLLPLLSLSAVQTHHPEKKGMAVTQTVAVEKNCNNGLVFRNEPMQGRERMLASVFKNQDFCRAEITDFPFDVHFKVVSATVYFSGVNFSAVAMGNINSNSLEPVRKLMNRCVPGSIVVFDDFKVVGPDNNIRTIQPLSIVLY